MQAPIDRRRRVAYGAVALSAFSVLVTARMLSPSPSGVGTHRQLGLPACPLRQWLGVPCPGCGLTTGFAHVVRGDFSAAWLAHPLATFGVAAVVMALAAALWGLVFPQRALSMPSQRSLVVTALLGLGAWCVRLVALP